MTTDAFATQSAGPIDLATLTQFRPAEIKTYHKTTYDRISPSKVFDGTGKTVLITGGATGIGFATAKSFAETGVKHIAIIQRRQEVLDAAKQSLESEYPGVKITTYAASVTDLGRITSILKDVGAIDVLVANVATSHPFVQSRSIATGDFQKTFDVNVVCTFHIIKEFLALDLPGPRAVIHTSSAVGQMVVPGNIGYGPSKAAANQMIQHFATEYAGTNVTFQTFHPGAILTETASGLVDKDTYIWEDVMLAGNFAVWLASPEAKFLAGRFVWAEWDVDDLLKLKGRIADNPALLSTTVIL